jgi:hypothetical protein
MVSLEMAMVSGDVRVKNSDSHVHELSSLGLFDDLLSLCHPNRVVVLAERDETDGIEVEVEACAFGQGERNEMARIGRQLSILRPEEGDPHQRNGQDANEPSTVPSNWARAAWKSSETDESSGLWPRTTCCWAERGAADASRADEAMIDAIAAVLIVVWMLL